MGSGISVWVIAERDYGGLRGEDCSCQGWVRLGLIQVGCLCRGPHSGSWVVRHLCLCGSHGRWGGYELVTLHFRGTFMVHTVVFLPSLPLHILIHFFILYFFTTVHDVEP